LGWTFAEWVLKGKPSLLGAASGCVAGLVGITPAAGFVGPMGALAIGAAAGFACVWGVSGLKRMFGSDDSLDVFGIHGVAGILGAILTGVFAAPALGGTGIFDYITNAASPEYSIPGQVWLQAQGVLVTLVWSAVVAYIAFKIADMLFGIRVPEDQEREGLDINSHGESAYEN
jgi:Amt family ammonium transporter